MSGGVDSSVAAAVLVRAGYDAVGCFMRLGSPGESLEGLHSADTACELNQPGVVSLTQVKIGHQGCCSINDAADARLVAAELGIPFYVCNFKQDFGRIIDYFVDEYASGRTPNPCVRCNDWLKFGKLHDYAHQIGAEIVASGHYARIGASPVEPDHPALLRGIDHSKDQSYVLFGVGRHQLSQMMFPIGQFEKDHVRDLAKQFGLPVFDKPDSQEICFVPDNNYAGLVERRRPDLARSGSIITESGENIGTHDGQHRFTIGQRRGLGISSPEPYFVTRKDPETNTVVVGRREQLASLSCTVGEANWLVPIPHHPHRVLARYRYNSTAVPATITLLNDADTPTASGRLGRFHVAFDQPQTAVAPGQAVVLYNHSYPDLVLGGGWILSVHSTI
ncbi:MAG: tRNA 2-thiouridine(34) synthase MnmA [Planctomycetes bacterium]|nr:tRNA 2-thiouridine(34) synthase MnmA [Planctomycetota bacterium]